MVHFLVSVATGSHDDVRNPELPLATISMLPLDDKDKETSFVVESMTSG